MFIQFKKILNLLFKVVVVVLIGLLLSHQLIYKLFIVPKLLDWNSIPFVWQIITFLPIIVAIIYVGLCIRSVLELLISSLVSAFITELYVYLMLLFNEPGFRQEPFYQSIFFNSRFLFIIIGFIIIISITWFVAYIIRKRLNNQAAA